MLSKNLNMLSKRRGNMSALRLEHTKDEAGASMDTASRRKLAACAPLDVRNWSGRGRGKQHLLGSFSLLWGILVAALCISMQTDAYRGWYKKAFRPWEVREYMYYYGVFVWLPLWFPVMAIGGAIFFLQFKRGKGTRALGKPTEHLMHRRWLPSVTPIEAVAYLLIALTALAWVFEKSYRTVKKSGWTSKRTMNGLAESLGIGTIPLLAGILLPAKATNAVFSFLHSTPERAVSYHKWIGFGTVLLVTLHGVAYFVYYYMTRGGWEGIRTYMFTNKTCITHSKCIPAGLGAMVAGLLFGFFSIYSQRRLNWRRFRVFHVLGTPIFFLGTVGHWSKFVWYLTPSLALYMAQAALRLHQHFYTVNCLVAVEEREQNVNHTSDTTTDDPVPPPELAGEHENDSANLIISSSTEKKDRVMLRFKLPWLSGHTHCGQWIGVGSAASWFPEVHPATIISAPRMARPELALALHRKSALAKEILTRKKRMSEGHWTQCRLKLKGPYGGVAPLDPTVPTLLIAGGTGVTPILALLHQEQQDRSSAYDYGGFLGEAIAQRSICWTLRGDRTGLGLMQGLWPQLQGLDCPNMTVHGTGTHSSDVEKIFMNEADEETYSNKKQEENVFQKRGLDAYFLHPSVRCAPPEPETDPIIPSIAACAGTILGLYSWFALDQWCLDIGQGWLRGPLTMLIQAGLAFIFVLGVIFLLLMLKKMKTSRDEEHLLMPLYTSKHSDCPSDSKAPTSLMPSAKIELSALDKSQMSSVSLSSEFSSDGKDQELNGNGREQHFPGGHRFVHGRPNLQSYLDGMGPAFKRMDVVVAGPPGLVQDCKTEIAKHPRCGKICLRELSFEM